MEKKQTRVTTEHKHEYTLFEKLFCCRCFHFMQGVTVLTSDIRRETLQKLIKEYAIKEVSEYYIQEGAKNQLYDPIKLMILMFLNTDKQILTNHIQLCRLNPNLGIQTYRTDLEFYVSPNLQQIPQLCNHLVYHEELKAHYLLKSMEKACRISYYFGHLFYFYMISLQQVVTKYQIQSLKRVEEYNNAFRSQMCLLFNSVGPLLSTKYYLSKGDYDNNIENNRDSQIDRTIKLYGTTYDLSLQKKEQRFQDAEQINKHSKKRQVSPKDIVLNNYTSIYNDQTHIQGASFLSVIRFFDDLFLISEELKEYQDKRAKLIELITKVNEKLPAAVYVPFSDKSIQLYNVLNIVPGECRVFSTKERAPYYICLEVFCPCEALSEQAQEKFWEKVETPQTLKYNFSQDNVLAPCGEIKRNSTHTLINGRKRNQIPDPYSNSIQTERSNDEKEQRANTTKFLEMNSLTQRSQKMCEESAISQLSYGTMKKKLERVFGPTMEEHLQKIKKKSIYRQFRTLDLVHIIVKTGDNLKQQQFALQLISEFDYIFKLQRLPLILTPYQVLTMGPDTGIIQMVRESITIDSLKKNINQMFPQMPTLREFFQINFKDQLHQAKDLFLRSLAAYSLVMYFLQVKDRHNGNILLHRTGKIFHIDFGFFLSNMPGKGVQLEKDIPFKLLTEYIEVLDGPHSYYFKKFREYLFYGFKAVYKHQNKILVLVKMMYSSSGMTLPCFQKGQKAITALEERFNPHDVSNDAELNFHCQKLIDSSLDNWAAKWYDRWQYWAQGIVY